MRDLRLLLPVLLNQLAALAIPPVLQLQTVIGPKVVSHKAHLDLGILLSLQLIQFRQVAQDILLPAEPAIRQHLELVTSLLHIPLLRMLISHIHQPREDIHPSLHKVKNFVRSKKTFPAAATPYPAGPAYAAAQQSSSNYKSDSIDDDVILMSIRDSTNDILKRRFADVNAQSRSEVDTLKVRLFPFSFLQKSLQSTENELKHGKSKLDAMMNLIESEKASCEEELRKCERLDEEMTAELQSLSESQEINPEDIITPSNPIYKQIFTHHNKEQVRLINSNNL